MLRIIPLASLQRLSLLALGLVISLGPVGTSDASTASVNEPDPSTQSGELSGIVVDGGSLARTAFAAGGRGGSGRGDRGRGRGSGGRGSGGGGGSAAGGGGGSGTSDEGGSSSARARQRRCESGRLTRAQQCQQAHAVHKRACETAPIQCDESTETEEAVIRAARAARCAGARQAWFNECRFTLRDQRHWRRSIAVARWHEEYCQWVIGGKQGDPPPEPPRL